jgi:hypothetical protein
MTLPKHIVDLVRQQISRLDPKRDGRSHELGRLHEALPLYADVGGMVLLRSDGTFIEVAWGSETAPYEPKPHFVRIALVAGSERYPWLKDLLPSRPQSAVSCADCSGTGRISRSTEFGDLDTFCHCCEALGWRPA